MDRENSFLERKKRELGVLLNEVQQAAVLQTEGPMLLLASPGSGKTTTLIMRIGRLIEEQGVEPSRIKAVTFSRASARDMKERFARFFPGLPPVDFSTIHSLAFEIVRERFRRAGQAYRMIEGGGEAENAGDAEGSREAGGSGNAGSAGYGQGGSPPGKRVILRNLFRRMTGDNMTEDQLEEIGTYISYVKNKMIPPERWGTVKVAVPEGERILREYEAFKRHGGGEERLLDFDDMLTLANEALEEDAGMLRRYQRRYDYVLTDESQDTSLVQHAIIEKLARVHRNLCVVADDDQSIYSWRGAEPSYLLRFKEVYPDATVLFMEQNYRSAREIVEAANRFIKRNRNRYPKNMFTHNEAPGAIKFKHLSDYRKQAKYLARELQKTEKLSEAAVLYRNHSSSIALMNEFDRAGIPFYMKDADNRFFSHWVVEDVLNFMRMTFTDKRADLLERIHLKFKGYISKHQMAVLKEIDNNESVFDNLLRFVQLKDYQAKLLEECKETFREMRGMPPRPAIQVIRGRLGYEKALEGMCERLGLRKDYLIGILNTLEDIAEGLESLEAFAARLKYLDELLRSAKGRAGHNAVTLSTFHSSKGLEFDRVYMIDLIDGVIPSADDAKRGADGEQPQLEEAVRLFYVGMTRARQHLELLSYGRKDGERTMESPFMEAIRAIVEPPEAAGAGGLGDGPGGARRRGAAEAGEAADAAGGAGEGGTGAGRVRYKSAASRAVDAAGRQAANPDAIRDRSRLAPGMAIRHRVFGPGVIVEVDDERIRLRFGGTKHKTLSVAMCLEMGLLEAAD